MLKLWSLTLLAMRTRKGKAFAEAVGGPLLADDGDEGAIEAAAKGMCLARFPEGSGWHSHTVTWCPVPETLIRQAVAALDAGKEKAKRPPKRSRFAYYVEPDED